MPEFDIGRIPPQLRRALLHGDGADEIRWGSDGDFDRCVRFLRRHGVAEKFLKGEYAELHKAATGQWPGAGRHHALDQADLQLLVASVGLLPGATWTGPLAPIGTPTGDGRVFKPNTLAFQTFPMPLDWAKSRQGGHGGAVTVGRILGAHEVDNPDGTRAIQAYGDWFDPDVIPEVAQAMALVEAGVAGPSVDLDTFSAVMTRFQGDPVMEVTRGRIRAATLVAIPAFANLRLTITRPQAVDATVDIDAIDPLTASVNSSGWQSAPIAPRDAEFDADDAVSRIEQYAGVGTDSPDEKKMSTMFLWQDPQGQPLDRRGFRLPWGDIIDGKPYLIYHAVYAASALLEGGHGGLPNIPDPDKRRLRGVISDIYTRMSEHFGDPQMKASWDKAQEKVDNAAQGAAMEEFTVRSSGWSDLPTSTGVWDEGRARAALDAWAGDSMEKYARGFLWFDADRSDIKGAYKFPIAMPVDGELTIFLRAVDNAKSRLSSASIPAADKNRIEGILNTFQERYSTDESGGDTEAMVAGISPVHPPKAWFTKPDNLKARNKIYVTDEGRIFGWAAPRTCHRGKLAATGICTTPPASPSNYAHFLTGTTKTAEGDIVDTGPLVWDTTHASENYSGRRAVAHYEHTGTAFADVVTGFADGGVWFSGAMRPKCTVGDFQVARQSPLSVDMRNFGRGLDLIALLAVNSPGFAGGDAIMASMGESDEEITVHFEDGEQVTLIASWGAEEEPEVEEAAEEVVVASVDEEPVAPAEDCGCPDKAAAELERFQPLLLPAEVKERQDALAGFGELK